MARTKMITRTAQDQRRQVARQEARARAKSAAAAVRPARQRTGV